MKFLLTSAGVTNGSIRAALVDLLGKPIEESKAICIPTAIYALPDGGLYAWQMLHEFREMGWKEFGVLELTALPSLNEQDWLPTLMGADAILVGGGNTGYLSYWLIASGLADKLPELLESKVYVGVSAGSAMVTAGINVNREHLDKTGIYYDDEYDEAAPLNAGSDRTLQLVNFVIRPHLNSEYFPVATPEFMARAAAKVDVPLYAFDDQTALKVVDGHVEVISEGEWKLFNADKKKL